MGTRDMQQLEEYHETEGHLVTVVGFDTDAESLRRDIVKTLEQIWMGGIDDSIDGEEYRDALKEIGIDLDEELRSRGLDDPFANDKYQLIKDYGDIGEVLGYLHEIEVRGILSGDVFTPLLWTKLRGSIPTHGLDAIGFAWGQTGQMEHVVLCEWKHTMQNTSIRHPCSSAAEEWTGLVIRRLLQEANRVKRIYDARGDTHKSEAVKWLAYRWQQRDRSVSCTTMIVYPDSLPTDKARQEIITYLINKCASHTTNSIAPAIQDITLFPLSDMEVFFDSCYEEFTK